MVAKTLQHAHFRSDTWQVQICVTTHCNILQHTATYCNTRFESLANSVIRHCYRLQHIAKYAKDAATLQHTATHCTTQQCTAIPVVSAFRTCCAACSYTHTQTYTHTHTHTQAQTHNRTHTHTHTHTRRTHTHTYTHTQECVWT